MQVKVKVNNEIVSGETESWLITKFKSKSLATVYVDGTAYICEKLPKKTTWKAVRVAS